MNKKLIGALLTLCFPFSAIALQSQQVDSNSLDKSQKIERVDKDPSLTQEQKTQIKSIFNEQKSKLKAMPEEKRANLQRLLTQELDKLHQHNQSIAGEGKGTIAP